MSRLRPGEMTDCLPLRALLKDQPVPPVGGDKDDRGAVVLVAGSETCPGGALLAAVAAFRSGAGRVQIITAPAVSVALAVAVPESLVVAWDGSAPVPPDVRRVLDRADAVCIGPGLADDATRIAARAAAHIRVGTPVLLDARAVPAVHGLVERGHRCIVSPNENEAVQLLEGRVAEGADATALAVALTRLTGTAAAVRGERTVVASEADRWEETGAPGLGTAGSGDVLTGVAAALLGRGVEPTAALGWAVAVHAWAGETLGGGRANPGFLARELVDLIPEAMEALAT